MKTIETEYLDTCLCCNSSDLVQYINLGDQPPCNALVSTVDEESPLIPLTVNVCQNCWHSQLGYVPKDMSVLWENYPYRTGVSDTLVQHYFSLAESIVKLKPDIKKVLDIGCNDCTLLNGFKYIKDDIETYGLDPFPVETPDFKPDHFFEKEFDRYSCSDLELYDHGPYDVITATNVLAHNKDPKGFIQSAAILLSLDGMIVLEFPYAKDMISGRQFDTMYHEHVSYFNISSICALLKNTNLFVYRVKKTTNHGGSLTIFLKHCATEYEDYAHHDFHFQRRIYREQEIKKLSTYFRFEKEVSFVPAKIREAIVMAREAGRRVIGFGASGKSSVFLNFTDIDIDYIIDQTPAKQGKFTPGKKHFPIVPTDWLSTEERDLAIIIFAWNCLDECVRKIQRRRADVSQLNDKIITYVPTVEVNNLFGERFPVET